VIAVRRITRFTDIETLTHSISFYLYLYRMQKIEEIRMQADLFYLHALYEFIDMITNTGVVDSHVACLSDLTCQNLQATTNENRDLFSDIVTDEIGRLLF